MSPTLQICLITYRLLLSFRPCFSMFYSVLMDVLLGSHSLHVVNFFHLSWLSSCHLPSLLINSGSVTLCCSPSASSSLRCPLLSHSVNTAAVMFIFGPTAWDFASPRRGTMPRYPCIAPSTWKCVINVTAWTNDWMNTHQSRSSGPLQNRLLHI